MFERYNEPARRALFFARYEVAETGGLSIEPEHLVLGVLRENSDVLRLFLGAGESADTIRRRLEPAITECRRVSTSVEIPFSVPCKEVLAQTAFEADALKNATIRPEHMILAVMVRAQGAAAQALRDAGIDPNAIRHYLRGLTDDPVDRPVVHASMSAYAVTQGVVRQWKGVVKPGLADEYIRHLQRETLPALARLDGFITSTILRRELEGGTEFQVTTLWRSLDAIKAFAGDDVTRAVVPPAAQALMVRYDERAIHYEIVQ